MQVFAIGYKKVIWKQHWSFTYQKKPPKNLSKKKPQQQYQTIIHLDWDGEEETVGNIGYESYYMHRHEILAAHSMS